jgi:type II secretory pathway pseudopilin PulG
MRNRDAGFSLAEALVAMALTLVVITSALSALASAARMTDTARIMSDTNQSLEVAMSLMERDFIQTGEAVPRGGIPIPTGAGAAPIVRPGPPCATPPCAALTFNGAWTTLPAVAPGGALGPASLGVATDIATLIYADPTLQLNQWPLAAIAADGSSMTVDARTSITGVGGIQPGDLIMISNAQGNAMQMVTRINGTQTVFFDLGDALGFNQRAAPQGTIMNLQTAPGVFPPTTATRMLMVSYYLDVVTDRTLPRLTRQINNGPPLAIALGIENVQFTFDLVDGVTNPANVRTIVDPNSPNQIRKANLYLAARSIDKDHQTGQYFRNSTATDVALRSLSFVNRYK